MATKEEVFEGVREALVEALAVDDDQVVPTATLVGDLGAESIDILDIVYRLEKTFSIKIERGELVPEDLVSNPLYVQDGKLTPEGVSLLRQKMPGANLTEFEKNPLVQAIPTVLTVRDMCTLVEGKLGA